MVVEHVAQGSLRDGVTTSSGSALPLTPKQVIAQQVAEALAYLHDEQIVHDRLTAFSVLLDEHWCAKLGIFAIFHHVRLSPLDDESCSYAAPEVRMGQQSTEKADVDAFGVLLVELDTPESPAANHRRRSPPSDSSETKTGDGVSTMDSSQGITLSHRCPPKMKDLITACLEPDAARRPSMRQVVQALSASAMAM